MLKETIWQSFPPLGELEGGFALFADRGFTGHEFISQFNLYNMNGRMYDPLVSRFLSVDNVIQDPTYTQNYNRYSYCLNNPLKFTDPSGWRMAALDQGWNLGKEATNFDRFYGYSGGYGYSSEGTSGSDGGWGGYGGVLPDGYSTGETSGYFYSCGNYYDRKSKNMVGFDEVYDNYVAPNASERYTVTQTAGSLDGGKTFTGNGDYNLIRLGNGVESTGLYPTFTSRDSGLNYINSFAGRNASSGGDGYGKENVALLITGYGIGGTLAFPGKQGLSGSAGIILGKDGEHNYTYKTLGNAKGLEATGGAFISIIKPWSSSFTMNDLSGISTSFNLNYDIFGVSLYTNSSHTYYGLNFSIGFGGGASTSTSNTTINKTNP